MPSTNIPLDPTVPAKKSEFPDAIAEEVVLDAQLGNERARKRVWLAYLPVVRRVARKYTSGLTPAQREDLISEGNIAIVKAMASWDPERHGRFVDHVENVVHDAVRYYSFTLRGIKRHVPTKDEPRSTRTPMVYLDKPLGEGEDAARFFDLPATTPSPEDEILRKDELAKQQDLSSVLRRHIEQMPGRLGRIVRDRYLLGLTLQDIAAREGVDRGTIKSWVEQGVEQMVRDTGIQEAWIDTLKPGLSGSKPSLPHAE